MTKNELRKQIRQAKGHFTGDQLRRMSLPIVRQVLAQREVAEARLVLAYASLKDEVDTRPLLDGLLAMGKEVVLPRVVDDEHMVVCRYRGADDLREGAFHIMEPVGEEFTDYDRLDVAIIPGMAFDRAGHRLGRGRGYYDRFLRQLPQTTLRLGMCFPFQLVDHVPHEAHDIVMDIVLTS